MDDDEHRMVGQFSKLRVFAVPPLPTSSSKTRKPVTCHKVCKMEGLAQDLNSALEESTRSSTSTSSTKRRFLRRRCKSTTNLSTAVAPTNAVVTGLSQQSDDSSTSSVEENVGLGLSSRGELGTSSLQLTDSDDAITASAVARKKRSESWNSSRVSIAQNESDSHNENVASVRPNTKRKRKFKRMAIDPAAQGIATGAARVAATPVTPSGTIKRKKVRSKTVSSDTPMMTSPSAVVTKGRGVVSAKPLHGLRPRQSTSTSCVVAGKRKRSTREKSVEIDLGQRGSDDLALCNLTSKDISMDCDEERRSSSSLSSTEWEDQDSGEGDRLGVSLDGGEADDEQSDWHDSAGPVFLLSDDEDSSEIPLSIFYPEGSISTEMQMENFNKLTSTARQAYLARMKRLAECVPGREIRAGTRRIRTRQSGFTIKSSSSEQLSRFLQDPSRTNLRLNVLRGADRSKIIHLANLYNLSVKNEDPHLLVLSKTGKTVKVDEFLVPKIPAAKAPVEVKRRRRTPPPTNDVDNIVMEEEEIDMSSSKNL